MLKRLLFPRIFSDERLRSLLNKERPSIRKALNNINKLPQLYKIGEEALFEKGDWYGATLVYKGQDFNTLIHLGW